MAGPPADDAVVEVAPAGQHVRVGGRHVTDHVTPLAGGARRAQLAGQPLQLVVRVGPGRQQHPPDGHRTPGTGESSVTVTSILMTSTRSLLHGTSYGTDKDRSVTTEHIEQNEIKALGKRANLFNNYVRHFFLEVDFRECLIRLRLYQLQYCLLRIDPRRALSLSTQPYTHRLKR